MAYLHTRLVKITAISNYFARTATSDAAR